MQLPKLRINLLFLVMSACFCLGQTQSGSGTGIEGVISVRPIHGGAIGDGIPKSNPLANATFIVENKKGVVASFTTDDQGHFRISLNPGHYTVSMKDKKGGIGYYGPFDADVVGSKMTKVEWQCWQKGTPQLGLTREKAGAPKR